MYWTGGKFQLLGEWVVANLDVFLQVGYWIAYAIGVGLASVVVGYAVFLISKTKPASKFISFLAFKLNGFSEAREVAKVRRKITRETWEEVKRREKSKKFWLKFFFWAFCPIVAPLRWIIWGCGRIVSKKEVATNGIVSVLTSFGVLWHLLVAVKHRACPLVSFVKKKEDPEAPETTVL